MADLGWVVLPYTPGRFDDTEIVGLPFVTSNATEASVALHRLYAEGALVGFEGLKMLAVGATPPVVIHANKPVRLPADLKGKRVRASGDHLTRVIEALGGAPVQVGGGQIAESLSRGVVDMTLNNWGFVGDFKVNEVSSQHLDLPLGAVAVGIVMRVVSRNVLHMDYHVGSRMPAYCTGRMTPSPWRRRAMRTIACNTSATTAAFKP